MSGERLTRTELTWLLTQEARSAADKLRKGVRLTLPPPDPAESGAEGDTGVESVLNSLDETMSALASLHAGTASRGRRGKIDIAALIWEIAPEARVQIDVGKGLVVSGEEGDLRRMLHVLMALSGDPALSRTADVSIKRENDEIEIAVQLGPDNSSPQQAETQWLSRMATRYGGRFALEGDRQLLVLLADDEKSEVETLRRELAAAQAQGEAFARELAAVIGKSETPAGATRSSQAPHQGDALPLLVASARAIVTDLRGILAAIGRDVGSLRQSTTSDAKEVAASVQRHVLAASELMGDLSNFARCPVGELPSMRSLGDILRDVVKDGALRASRHDVTLELDIPGADLEEPLPSGVVSLLFHELADWAIYNSPAQGIIKVSVASTPSGTVVTFDDAGTAITPKARSGIAHRDFEPLAAERSGNLALIGACAVAAHMHVPLSVEDVPSGGVRVRVVFPRGVA